MLPLVKKRREGQIVGGRGPGMLLGGREGRRRGGVIDQCALGCIHVIVRPLDDNRTDGMHRTVRLGGAYEQQAVLHTHHRNQCFGEPFPGLYDGAAHAPRA